MEKLRHFAGKNQRSLAWILGADTDSGARGLERGGCNERRCGRMYIGPVRNQFTVRSGTNSHVVR